MFTSVFADCPPPYITKVVPPIKRVRYLHTRRGLKEYNYYRYNIIYELSHAFETINDSNMPKKDFQLKRMPQKLPKRSLESVLADIPDTKRVKFDPLSIP